MNSASAAAVNWSRTSGAVGRAPAALAPRCFRPASTAPRAGRDETGTSRMGQRAEEVSRGPAIALDQRDGHERREDAAPCIPVETPARQPCRNLAGEYSLTSHRVLQGHAHSYAGHGTEEATRGAARPARTRKNRGIDDDRVTRVRLRPHNGVAHGAARDGATLADAKPELR